MVKKLLKLDVEIKKVSKFYVQILSKIAMKSWERNQVFMSIIFENVLNFFKH